MLKVGVILVSRASGTFCTSQLSLGRGGAGRRLLQQASWSSRRPFSLTQLKFIGRAGENQSPSIKPSQNWNDGKIPAGGWFLLVLPVSTLALGIWQKGSSERRIRYSNQVLIGPRALVSPEDRTSGRQMSRGVFSSGSTRNGYHIITPFKVEGNGETILVNRGWVESRNFAKYNHVQGPTEIVGIVRKTEQRSPFITKSRPGENL
ncbi:SURF1-like protein [Orchesella cincta]|uniref:SURF1-like protein n=1 Tax=Orchesella cincta TaxID=48709 RepID=A0A1D2MZA8_ORCCI|nr:SURF1-like protein [Orchesella cincta]